MEIHYAPDPTPEKLDLFMAGGISNCPDWQKTFETLLASQAGSAANPRREFYDAKETAEIQIRWEFEALSKSRIVSFWFPKETLCPITLFELGRFSHQKETMLLVGVEPGYQRAIDVEFQLALARPEVQIVNSLEELASQVMQAL